MDSWIKDLRLNAPVVEPSLLACDFARLGEEIRRLEEAGARILHLDIMDGHFVPNLSFGIPVVEAVRRSTHLLLDVHLMITNPDAFIVPFRRAGADLITVHIETDPDPRPLLREIRRHGAAAGLSLNPPTSVSMIAPYLEECDQVLVMSVMPGFGGQPFNPVALDKLRWLRDHGPRNLLLAVDGGVNAQNVAACAAAGAHLLVVGTALFSQDDYRATMNELTALAQATVEPSKN